MGHFFKSKKQRERELNRERRRAQYQAEDAAKEVEQRIQQMDKAAQKDWDAAVKAKQTGDKRAVARALNSFRGRRVLITKLDQKRWVFEQYLQKILAMQVDDDFTSALEGLTAVVAINPEKVGDVFLAARDLLSQDKETARTWEREYWREMGEVENASEDAVPSMENLEKQLEAEAAGAVMASAGRSSDAEAQISAGLDRVKKILSE